MLNGLDLFSGIGGLTLALSEWVRPVAYCEIEPYAQSVLLSRMASFDLPTAAIWDDVCTLRGDMLPIVDIIYGGFPCQDISVAGNGKGLEGKRSGLFFEIVRLAKELKPSFVFLENSPNIRTKGLDVVCKELADCGYDCRWMPLSAAEVGAIHKRNRWWLLAHSRRKQKRADKDIQPESKKPVRADATELCWGAATPAMGRKADGVPFGVERVITLGNAVVPQCAKEAFETLLGIGGTR